MALLLPTLSRVKREMSTMLAMLMASAVVGMLGAPLWGRLSDRVGRRPVFIFGALASGILMWPYLWAVDVANVPLILVFGILLGGVAYNAALGVWPALCAEMFSTPVRMSGLAIGTQLGFMFSAQVPTVAAFLTRHALATWSPAAWLVSASRAVSALAVFASRETGPVAATHASAPGPTRAR